MIAPWLLYATFIGALLCVAGLAGERALRWRREPTRWLWLAVVGLTVSVPVVLNLASRNDLYLNSGVVSHSETGAAIAGQSGTINRWLLVIWLCASVLVALRVVGTAIALRRRRRVWIPAALGPHNVLLTDELGPAVIGWRRFTTVLPRWAFTFDESARALMLEHEAEHARAGDPHLRTAALLALILMPWNLALWWTTRRLRLAVEIDCDRRLLDRGVDPRRYASLLLAVGERISATPFAWATALGESPSSLEQRIIAMTSRHLPRHPRVAKAAVNTAVVLIALVACAAPVPDSVLPPSAPTTAAALLSAKVARDSHVPFLVTDCEVGSSCTAAPKGDVVFQKKVLDVCETGKECLTVAGTVIEGDSIWMDADTIHVYRAKGSVSPGTEPATSDRRDAGLDNLLAAQQLMLTGAHDQTVARPGAAVRAEEQQIPACTPAQLEARRRGLAGGAHYLPRCIEP